MLPWQPFFGFVYMCAHWHHMANTTEQSVCGSYAALRQITLTTSYNFMPLDFSYCPQKCKLSHQSDVLIIATLCNRAGHYIFMLWFLSLFFFYLSFFSSPILSRRRLHVYHTCTHGVALLRI